MGNWTLGRVGLDVVANSADAPTSWDVSGDDIHFKGVLRASSAIDANFLRLQLNGLVDNPDEPWVPFTWTEDPYAWDMIVKVNSVDISTVPMSLTAGWFPFEVSMSRLPGSSYAPLVESRLVGALRLNSHTITNGTTTPWWATPTDATQDLTVYGVTAATRTGDGGSVKVQYTENGVLLYDAQPTMQLAPADWYDMSAKIEMSGDGSNYRASVGRQIANLTTLWRLTNGLVRVTYGGGAGLITVQHYSAAASAWQNAKTYKLTFSGTPTAIGAFSTVTVLRNSPECVSIRLSTEMDSSTLPWPTNVDLTLRRGSLYVEGFVSRPADPGGAFPIGYNLGICRNTAEAATAHTSGVHATSADAGTGGGKYILTTPAAKTNNLTQGGFVLNGGADMPFMIGYEPASASGPDTFTNQVHAYFAAVTERQTPVQR